MQVSLHAGELQLSDFHWAWGWRVRLLISPPHPTSPLLRESRRQRSIELGQGAVCFYVHSFFLSFCHRKNMWACPFPPSATCKNLSVTMPVLVLLLLCLGHALDQPKRLPGWFRTCWFVQLDIGYKPGSGEGCHGAADTHIDQGWWAGVYDGKKLIRFFQRPWKPLIPYIVPREHGDVLWFDLRPWGWCIFIHLFLFGIWLFFIVPMTWACFNACHVLVDLRDWLSVAFKALPAHLCLCPPCPLEKLYVAVWFSFSVLLRSALALIHKSLTQLIAIKYAGNDKPEFPRY